MLIYQYKYKFYLNASHFIMIKNKKGEAHSHCFEIIVDIALVGENSFLEFNKVEKRIGDILFPYQDRLVNEVDPFDRINPTLENMCGYFEGRIFNELKSHGLLLLTIEMSETPTRSYVINVAKDKVERGIKDITQFGIEAEIKAHPNVINFSKYKKEQARLQDYDYDLPEELLHYDLE